MESSITGNFLNQMKSTQVDFRKVMARRFHGKLADELADPDITSPIIDKMEKITVNNEKKCAKNKARTSKTKTHVFESESVDEEVIESSLIDESTNENDTVRSKIVVRHRNLVIFCDFLNNFRRKQKFSKLPCRLVLWTRFFGNFYNLDFLASNYFSTPCIFSRRSPRRSNPVEKNKNVGTPSQISFTGAITSTQKPSKRQKASPPSNTFTKPLRWCMLMIIRLLRFSYAFLTLFLRISYAFSYIFSYLFLTLFLPFSYAFLHFFKNMM